MSLISHICGFVDVPKLITIEQYFGSELPNVSESLKSNAKSLLLASNSLLAEMGVSQATQTSGYRSPEHNKAIGGAPNSKHCFALALDLADNDRKLGDFLQMHQNFLQKRGMAMEDLNYCIKLNGNRWIHIQNVLPASGKTIFQPYSGPPRLT